MAGLALILVLFLSPISSFAFQLSDVTHYLDYVPRRVEGLVGGQDFRTAANPPSHLRDRKMSIGSLKIKVEDVMENTVWPARWPYNTENFRPLDYTRDEVVDTGSQYITSQRLIDADYVTIVPGLVRVPARRHFVMPKDKIAFSEHISPYAVEGARVLELFSCYESILPAGVRLGPTVGVGWSEQEMLCNPRLDDCIQQDITVDPFLPLSDGYFDLVTMPAMFQLLQRPLDLFREIHRVLKPGGVAVVGVKLSLWSFLGRKQGRYYVETNYLEDVLALGSFFHYAGGFSASSAYDLTLPEVSILGKTKDALFPNPRMDFYACVEARKCYPARAVKKSVCPYSRSA